MQINDKLNRTTDKRIGKRKKRRDPKRAPFPACASTDRWKSH